VQARACAPLWALFTAGREGLAFVAEHPTLAEGVRVRFPQRGDAVLAAVKSSLGSLLAVDEEEILPARDELARLGFYVEPTSAIAWAALAVIIQDLPDPVVVVLTGSGYKYG
jgi:threonine synthase